MSPLGPPSGMCICSVSRFGTFGRLYVSMGGVDVVWLFRHCQGPCPGSWLAPVSLRLAATLCACVCARALFSDLLEYAYLQQGRDVSRSSAGVPSVFVLLLSGCNKAGSTGLISGSLAPSLFLLLCPAVHEFCSALFVGAEVWILFSAGGVLIRLFNMVVPGRDANMHAQQRRAVNAK